ncbi:hypothetical protein IRZ71_18760 [Flavobacterium sp. ANB]|uniref:hypothetical protein n=1 Tax=unclassified Flavobacterium TaxID=196869 RepID=UPI0012B92AA9|nr:MULTISPECIES: hypothetical protein [unclassified Flavobacterium]MBF4518402.1 hypothetical protein [Flavobacterium sp. ANB]MTD70904.1 hypothetical protein [Flavobacterium sp. LC2016-13]
MKKLLLLILLISFKTYSQDSLRVNQVYFEKGLYYKVETETLFTGKRQSYKHKNHLVSEETFVDGQLKKYTIYFNGKKRKICEEVFYDNNGLKEKRIRYDYGIDFKWITYYNDKKEKTLEEDFKNGVVVYRCEYLNNKKNGILFSINDKGEKTECKYVNGKFIK